MRLLRSVICLTLFSLRFAPATGTEPEIPFTLLHNQILLEVSLGGRGPYNFVLDSGTLISSVDLGLARKLRLRLDAAPVRGYGVANQQVRGFGTVLPRVELAGYLLGDLDAVALDLSAASRQFGRPLHGVLGYSFLSTRIVAIDYYRRRIGFPSRVPMADSSLHAAPNRIQFPMQFREGSVLPVLEDCYVNGQRVSVTLDTGSSLGLTLFPEAIRHLGLEKQAEEGIPLEAAGYGGRIRLTKGWVRSVALGPIDLGAIEVAFLRRGYHQREPLQRRGGNIGNALLQDFVLILDYRNGMVVLEAATE